MVTFQDLDKLQDQGEGDRMELAKRIGQYLTFGESEADRHAAYEISRVLACDASAVVRTALAQEVRRSEFLPPDLIDKIISDIDEVSTEFVSQSKALDDNRLMKLVRLGNDALHLAIAEREYVSESLSYALCEVAKEPAVTKLVANGGAVMSSRACFMVVERFPGSDTLLELLSQRGDLPLNAVELLLERLSDQVADILVKRYKLAADFASYIAGSAKRRALGQTLEDAPAPILLRYMRQMRNDGDLTSDMVLHLVRNGQIKSFLSAVSVLTGVELDDISTQIDTKGPAALHGLLTPTGMANATISAIASSYKDAMLGFGSED